MRYRFNTFNHTVWLGLPPSLPAQIDAAGAAGYDHVGLDIPSVRAHEALGLVPEALADQLTAAGVTPFELTFLAVLADVGATRAGLADALELVKVLRPVHVQVVIMGRGFDGVVGVEVLSAEWRARPLDEFVRATLATTRACWSGGDEWWG